MSLWRMVDEYQPEAMRWSERYRAGRLAMMKQTQVEYGSRYYYYGYNMRSASPFIV